MTMPIQIIQIDYIDRLLILIREPRKSQYWDGGDHYEVAESLEQEIIRFLLSYCIQQTWQIMDI